MNNNIRQALLLLDQIDHLSSRFELGFNTVDYRLMLIDGEFHKAGALLHRTAQVRSGQHEPPCFMHAKAEEIIKFHAHMAMMNLIIAVSGLLLIEYHREGEILLEKFGEQ